MGRSGGLLFFWKDDWDVTVHSYSRGHIDVTIISEEKIQWRFTGFYGNSQYSMRKFSWELLRHLKGMFSLPWVCGGDFNEISSPTEKVEDPENCVSRMVNFQCALTDSNLSDLGFVGLVPTWNDRRNGVLNVQERLDCFVCTDAWRLLFPNASVHHMDIFVSDHRTLVLFLAEKSRPSQN
ncbi:Endonuclease/exonuclease/phosphatase [Parasponia andersonii]|uniref:Endonuclease/exonuclease/phosphatase n=1 Tax=Parasponia andersonii TaxID=3476 RepID=A0A2P5CRL6_PARAD|nr:Endonuclease/exonuclease/phosphatase [Parasponia andersonii]